MTTMPHGMDQQVFLQTLAFGGKTGQTQFSGRIFQYIHYT